MTHSDYLFESGNEIARKTGRKQDKGVIKMQDRSRRESQILSVFSVRSMGLLLLLSLSIGCGNWHEFGNGPTNPHATKISGPVGGISTATSLPAPSTSLGHGSEIGVLTDSSGAYYVTSYAPEIHVYDPSGVYQATYNLPGDGSRAVPYVLSDYAKMKSMIFAGAESGGFFAIEVDKTTSPYTMTLMDSDMTVGTSESSPKRAQDGTLYLAGQWGDVMSFDYNSSTGTLTRLSTYPIGEVITGAIALYDADPSVPGEEVLVATREGGFYVLDHGLTTILWSELSGHLLGDEFYAGVTVAERGTNDPIALLPIAARISSSANSGLLRAINLYSGGIEWELIPSATTLGNHEIPGSVSLLPDGVIGAGTTTTTTTTDDDPGPTIDTGGGGLVVGGGDISGGIEIDPETNDDGITIGDNDDDSTDSNSQNGGIYGATFASTDQNLYAVDLITGLEVWSYPMTEAGYDAPVTDGNAVVYVGDGQSVLHAVDAMTGLPVWIDFSISVGGVADIVKLGISYRNELVAGSGSSAYFLN